MLSFPVHNFPSVVLLFAQYVGYRAHWRSVGVRTAISFSIWSEVQAAVKESPITPPPNHDWRGRKSRGGLSSPLHRAQPPPTGSRHKYIRVPRITGTAVLLLLLQSIIPPITSSLPQSRSSKRLLLHFQGKWENSIVQFPAHLRMLTFPEIAKKLFHTIFEGGWGEYLEVI